MDTWVLKIRRMIKARLAANSRHAPDQADAPQSRTA
jgi:hypothetical protein